MSGFAWPRGHSDKIGSDNEESNRVPGNARDYCVGRMWLCDAFAATCFFGSIADSRNRLINYRASYRDFDPYRDTAAANAHTDRNTICDR
jgi:hypothetical protein